MEQRNEVEVFEIVIVNWVYDVIEGLDSIFAFALNSVGTPCYFNLSFFYPYTPKINLQPAFFIR